MNCAEHPGNETGRRYGDDPCQAVIDRALDALMAAHGCSEQVAAGILTGVARSARAELHTVAGTVVAVTENSSESPPEAIRAAITCALRNVLP